MESVSISLSRNLVYLRKLKGASQQDLSKLSGVPRPTIANIESGQANPSLKTLLKISHAMQISIEELLSVKKIDALLTKENEVKRRVFKSGAVTVSKLLPENLKPIEFERIDIKGTYSKTGIPHLPGTKEIFHCIEGEITVVIEGEEYNLRKGDVLSFSGNHKHSYLNKKNKNASGISLVILN